MSKIEVELLTGSKSLIGLCTKYWQIDHGNTFKYTVAQISSEFDVPKNQILNVVKENCIAILENDVCVNCGAPRALKSRNDFIERKRYYSSSWKCSECTEAEKLEAETLKENEVNLIYNELNDALIQLKEDGIYIEHMSFEDAIYMLSLLRVGGSEDLSYICPHEKITDLLSPTSELDFEIIDHLYKNNLIGIHPGSSSEAVIFDCGKFTKFYPLKVHWTLPLKKDGPSPSKFVENLENLIKSDEWPEAWYVDSEKLHRVVAFHECIQYLKIVVEDHGFSLKVGEKTKLVIYDTLNSFSVAQVYNFIWKAARDAAAFYVREGTSKAHAANIIPGAIQRTADRAIAENWDVKPFNRDFRAPQSMVSEVLFNAALKIGEDGFKKIPPKK